MTHTMMPDFMVLTMATVDFMIHTLTTPTMGMEVFIAHIHILQIMDEDMVPGRCRVLGTYSYRDGTITWIQ